MPTLPPAPPRLVSVMATLGVGHCSTACVRSPSPLAAESPFLLVLPLRVGVAHRGGGPVPSTISGSVASARFALVGPFASRETGEAHVVSGADDEGSHPSVRSPHVHSSKAEGFDAVAKGHEIMLHTGQPRALARGDVLDDDGAGAEGGDDAGVLEPEPASLSFEPSPLACAGNVLAWKSAAEDIDGLKENRVN